MVRAREWGITRSRREPRARGPATPLRPAAGAEAASGAGSGPGAWPRPTGAGTRARGPGLPARVAVRHRLRGKASRAAGAEDGWGWRDTSNP